MEKNTLMKLRIISWAMGFTALALLLFGIIRELFLK